MSRDNLKIALFISDLEIKGGTHKQVLRLAQYLTKKGHNVKIFTPVFNLENTYPEFKNINVFSIKKSDNISNRYINFIVRLKD